MILPILILYTVFIIFSIATSIYYSFFSYSGIGKATFVGLDNYRKLFSKDFIFRIALTNNILVILIILIAETILAFLIALLLSNAFKGSQVVRGMIFTPNIISTIIIGLLWLFILDPTKGILNSLLRRAGLEVLALDWIGTSGKITVVSFAIVSIWNTLGFYTTIFLAGLAAIPEDVNDAAKIDGASDFQRTMMVTIPLMKETFKMIILLIITNGFKLYEIVLQLTNGGPSHSSETLVNYMYNTTFTNSRYGYGMAIATMTFLVSCAFSVFYLRMSNRGADDTVY